MTAFGARDLVGVEAGLGVLDDSPRGEMAERNGIEVVALLGES